MGQRGSSSIKASFWLVLIAATWAAFAPTQLGGRASLILVSGSSMEPDFHSGDLVIVRQESSYQAGDIVAYRNPDLGNVVFHRIIAQALDRYTLKGDSNSWIDSYRPLREDVIGRLWIDVPGGAKWFGPVRQPVNMALMAGILGGIMTIGMSSGRPKGRRNLRITTGRDGNAAGYPLAEPTGARVGSNPGGPPGGAANPKQTPPAGPPAEAISFTLGLIVFASLIGGLVAFANPVTKSVPDDVNFVHLAAFTYSGMAPAGVYDSSGLKAGDPIFPKITCAINLGSQYVLVGNQPKDPVVGSYRLEAVVAEPSSGWERAIGLVPETPFTGNSFATRAAFNVCQVTTMIDEMEGQTGFHSGRYTLSFNEVVHVSGTLSGHRLADSFSPGLVFAYDRTGFYVVRDDPSVDPLHPFQPGLIRASRSVPNTISLFGANVSVPAMRVASIACLLLSALGFIGLARYLQYLRDRDPLAFVRAKYAPLLVDIQYSGAVQGAHIKEVATIDDLAKLAARDGGIMLHAAGGRSHHYIVEANGATYQYTSDGRDDGASPDIHPEDDG